MAVLLLWLFSLEVLKLMHYVPFVKERMNLWIIFSLDIVGYLWFGSGLLLISKFCQRLAFCGCKIFSLNWLRISNVEAFKWGSFITCVGLFGKQEINVCLKKKS